MEFGTTSMEFCKNPVQCAAYHELGGTIRELNEKMRSMMGLLQLFFQSWKMSQEPEKPLQPQTPPPPVVQPPSEEQLQEEWKEQQNDIRPAILVDAEEEASEAVETALTHLKTEMDVWVEDGDGAMDDVDSPSTSAFDPITFHHQSPGPKITLREHMREIEEKRKVEVWSERLMRTVDLLHLRFSADQPRNLSSWLRKALETLYHDDKLATMCIRYGTARGNRLEYTPVPEPIFQKLLEASVELWGDDISDRQKQLKQFSEFCQKAGSTILNSKRQTVKRRQQSRADRLYSRVKPLLNQRLSLPEQKNLNGENGNC